ncbi:MAG: hypothetical protein IPJ33_19470 [Gammaproteobacteria bacterium]|nr:hypothetical protein [Gammaproteobacteria bacterium]
MRIRSSDPGAAALIRPNHLGDEYDRRSSVAAVRQIRAIAAQHRWQRSVARAAILCRCAKRRGDSRALQERWPARISRHWNLRHGS